MAQYVFFTKEDPFDFNTFLGEFNHAFTLFIIFPGIVSIGLYLTIKLRFIQVSRLKQSCTCLTTKAPGEEGNISRFGAISAVLAGNFGTGNISGMAVAIATGGPGALVWMWLMAFFGAAIQYASCVLGVMFRHKTQDNEYIGGPMYYLKDGLGYRRTASLFALFTIFGAITVGNFAQVNSVILPLEKLGCSPFACSIAIAALVGIVVLGGIQRIAQCASYVVPGMALLYLGSGAAILALHADQVLPALKLMFSHALGFSPVVGGALGMGVFKAITTGFDRGLFATDAGTGIVPILQSGAKSHHPVIDGISTLLAPVMVMIVCTTTGLVLLLTGAWEMPGLKSTNMVTYAFSKGLATEAGNYIVIVALILFAYTTVLAWAYCGEKALGFLIGAKQSRWFRILYVILIPVGSLMQVDIIWSLADIAITFMVTANLIGIFHLSDRVIDSTRQFTSLSQPT